MVLILDRSDSIDVRDIPEQHVLGTRGRTDMARIVNDIGAMYQELFGYLNSEGIPPFGPPYAEYFEVNENDVDLDCGVAVAPGTKGQGRIAARVMPGGKALRAVHRGPYETMVDTYNRIDAWVKANGYVYAGNVREIYLSNPQQDKDGSKWTTEIVWPVRKT